MARARPRARHALPRPRRGRLALGILGIALSFVAGVAAGPVLGLTPARPVEVAAPAPPAAAAAAASATPVPSPPPTASPTAPKTPEPDCTEATDERRTRAERATPFTVCGVELINKSHRVSAAYAPKLVTVAVRASGLTSVRLQKVAATALTRMATAARRAGYTLVVRSAYRSYATQASWYATKDKRLTAPAGASEHQSGLAVDLAGIEGGRLVRGTALGGSRTGAWLLEHAADYGFILRYPTSQSKITGIAYEPWHFRHVGVKVARGVDATKTKTLERYLEQG